MGVSRNVYLGPYFRCRTRTETRPSTVEACVNPACPLRGVGRRSIPFCSQCGWAIDRAFPVEETVALPDQHEVSEVLGEALTEVTAHDADFGAGFGRHIWIPNKRRLGEPDRDVGSSSGVEVAVDDVDIESEKRWLTGAFPEWATLAEMYGAGNVETRWGLLRWCS